MAGLLKEFMMTGSIWEQPYGSVLAIIIVFVGMIFLMFYVTRVKTKEQIKLSRQIENERQKFKLLAKQIEGICFLYQPDKDEMVLISGRKNSAKESEIFEKGEAGNEEERIIRDFSVDAVENAKKYLVDYKDFGLLLEELRQKKSGISQKYLMKNNDSKGIQEWMEVKADYLPDKDGLEGIVVGSIWINKRTLKEERMDDATGLYREDIMKKEVAYALSNATTGVRFACLLVKINDYSQYKDNYSSDIPQKVDRRVGICIHDMFRENDLAGRMAEDTYLVLMDHVTSKSDVIKKAEEFPEALNRVQRESEGGSLNASIGISFYPMDGEDYDVLYSKALLALNQAVEEKTAVKCYE